MPLFNGLWLAIGNIGSGIANTINVAWVGCGQIGTTIGTALSAVGKAAGLGG